MAFNKIQPEQIQLHTFFSDSGDLNIVQSNTGVQMNLSRNLTGDFSFTGDLSNNGRRVAQLASTENNIFDPDKGNFLFLGSNTDIGDGANDYDNFAISSNNSSISGINNAVFRANAITFNAGSQENVCLAGHGITFSPTATGNTVLKDDLSSTSLTVTTQHSFHAQFASGYFFNGGDVNIDNSLIVEDSGIFKGTLDVLSDAILSGSTIVNEELLNGERTITGTQVYETGFQIPKWLGATSVAGSAAAPATGALAILGSTLYVYKGLGAWGGIHISGAII
jgi:hypothetical protein